MLVTHSRLVRDELRLGWKADKQQWAATKNTVFQQTSVCSGRHRRTHVLSDQLQCIQMLSDHVLVRTQLF